jgi:glutathione synthase/RimK-type ligase-like ATP-grasp enzyme
MDFLLSLKAHGADAYFATDNATYQGNGQFSVAFTTDQKVPLSQLQKVTNVTADVVYDMANFTGSGVKVLNTSLVQTITASKSETYKHFASYQPFSIVCHDQTQYLREVRAMPGRIVVVKKPTGSGGHGVRIAPKQVALDNLPLQYPVLVQAFMDTSCGIDGYVAGMHDMRVKMGGGTVWGGTLRTPAIGEYRANVAQGGTEKHLFPSEIPEAAIQMAVEIDRYFAGGPRYYAIDLANTPDGWKLIEINGKPGLSPVSMSAQARHITDMLASYLVSLA